MTAPRLPHTAPAGGMVLRMRSSGLLALVFITFAASGAFDTLARAEESVPAGLPEFLASPPALPPGYDERTAWRLDLTEALKIAMQQNLGITIERKAKQSAELAVESATAGMYEPTLSAGVTHTRADQPGTVSSGGLPDDRSRFPARTGQIRTG